MEFPQWVVDRVVARQGRLHPFDQLDARKLALVVIDMQNYFLLPEFPAAVRAALDTLPAINRLCAAVRQAGGRVVWVQTTSENAAVHWALHHNEALTPERKRRRLESLRPGSRGYALHEGLDVHPEDIHVQKICFSALVEGSSPLKSVLEQHGVETLLIAGTATNVCCDSTARDAMMLNYRVIMVDDALSAFTPDEHAWALQNWMLFFGDVLPVDEVEALLRPGGVDQAAGRLATKSW